jgi:hypothetical protein
MTLIDDVVFFSLDSYTTRGASRLGGSVAGDVGD